MTAAVAKVKSKRVDKSEDKTAKSKKDKAKKTITDPVQDMVEAMLKVGGDGSAQTLGSNVFAMKIRGVISTRCAPLDMAIGRGGIPLGRISILTGKEGSGKTTIALHLVAETLSLGGLVIYIDAEYKLDPDYARALGVDLNRVIISQPPYLEMGYELILGVIERVREQRKATGKRLPVLIVLDSIDALKAKAQVEGAMEDRHIGAQARVHSESIPKLLRELMTEDVALLLIAQVRTKIGKMFGDPDELSGGNAVRFYSSLIMKVTNLGGVRVGGSKKGGASRRIANKTRVECIKNQIAPPFKRAEFQITYGIGIDTVMSTFDAALAQGIVVKSGSHFKLADGKPIAQGAHEVVKVLRKDTALLKAIEGMIDPDFVPDDEDESEDDDD